MRLFSSGVFWVIAFTVLILTVAFVSELLTQEAGYQPFGIDMLFSRSGSLVVTVSLFTAFVAQKNAVSRAKEISLKWDELQGSGGDPALESRLTGQIKTLQSRQKDEARLGYVALAVGSLGTLVWGLGDLVFRFIL